jgi:hypothetical protein
MIDVKQLIISLTTLMSAVVQGYILKDVAASVAKGEMSPAMTCTGDNLR